jgi:hypothetical protein
MLVSGHVLIATVLVQTNCTFAKHSVTWQSSLHELNNHAKEEEDK